MKKKLSVILGSLFLALISVFVPVALRGGFNITKKAEAFYKNNTSGAAVVNEIWKGNGFDKRNTERLLKMVTGNASVNVDNIGNLNSLATSKRTAYQMKTTGVLKSNSEDIIVYIGGLKWTVTYLSTDKDGNPILTLWLSDGGQLSGRKYDVSKTFGSYAEATVNNGFGCSNSPTSKHPDNMYGTSYMSCVVLNNGGEYSTSANGANTATFTSRSDSVFAPFTITTENNSAIADFIVTPEQVSWQESGQSSKQIWGYCYSNENWSKTTSNSGFYNGNFNYATRDKSDAWKNDFLWLPSLTETGYSGENQGIWGTSYNQRYHENYAWLRSSYYNNATNYLSICNNSYTYDAASYNSRSVRPAFHLNLNKVLEHIVESTGYVEEIWDSENQEINTANLNKLYSYLTGNTSATYSDVLALANQKKTAADFRSIAVADKTASMDITVRIGNLDWTATYLSTDKNGNAILTLWLDYASGTSYYSSFRGSNSMNSNYPDNCYGTSYMRSVHLNNGGMYTTASNWGSLPYRAQQRGNIYAPFTMELNEGKNLVDYIVTPEFVSWQETGQDARSMVSYKLSNENWSINESNTGFYGNNQAYNYARRIDNDNWKKDHVWLPSLSEVGQNNSKNGIWKTTTAQRRSSTNAWLRSSEATTAYYNYYIYLNGTSDTTTTYAYTNNSYGIRPAIHFNLNIEGVEAPEEITPKDETSYVKVNELWDEENSKIDTDSFNKLMQYVLGNETFTYNSIVNTAKTPKNSTNFRANAINGKTNSQDIVVTLGGFEWTVTYLSTSNYGEPILTLWLNDSSQLSGLNYDTTKTFDELGKATWNSGSIPHDSLTANPPDNLYGSSYMNSVVLNNGGNYVSSSHAAVTGYTKRQDSAFSAFTMQNNTKRTIADFIVTPSLVSWQSTGQLAQTRFGTTYNFSNENLGSIANTNYYTHIWPGSTYYNYSGKSYNNTWGARYLWLPSLCETGYGSNANEGIWGLSDAQRSNVSSYWLRTAYDTNSYESLYLTSNGENYGKNPINYTNSVRPALHFNLNMAYASAVVTERDESSYVKVDELWNSESGKMSDTNLDTLIKYLTGSEKAGYSELVKLAREKKNASFFRANNIGDKNSTQDIILTLGGLEWTTTYLSTDKNGNVILTLWLASDYQPAWQGLNYKNGVMYEITNNTLQGKYSNWFLSGNASQYHDTMYGTSYIRAITLNNGGTYTSNTTTANYARKNASNIFANFTMPVSGQYNDLTDFLVTPLNVSWQESQSFYNIYGQGNNYSNEAWMFNFPATNFASGTSYGNIVGNDIWKNDYLWLPSYAEVATMGNKSFWGLSSNQLHTYNEEFYLRSYSNVKNNVFAYSGLTNSARAIYVTTQSAIRPAMHLNLTAILESLLETGEGDNSVIYLDTENGNDLYNGLSYLKPVKTIQKAEELVAKNGVIEIMNKVTILNDVTLGKNKFYTLKRWEGAEYVTGYWGTLLQVGNYENSSNKQFANLTLNVVVNGNDTKNVTNLNGIYELGIVAIDVNYGKLIFSKNSGIESFNNKLYSHLVYLRREESCVVVNDNFYARGNLGNDIIYAENIESEVIINGGTFENNYFQYLEDDSFASIIYGGNIKIKDSKFINNFESTEETFNVNNCVIKLNASGKILIEDSIFASNLGTIGGVIYAEDASNISIKNTQFINNNVDNIGGVIYLSGNNTLDIYNSVFTGNSAKVGGAIFALDNNNITINKSNFSENTSVGSFEIEDTIYTGGGAILLKSSGNTVVINYTDFNKNTTNLGNGGAICVDGSNVKFSIENCNFYGNIAKENGGSLYVNDSIANSRNEIKINKCNFEGSTAENNGGAIYLTENISANIYNSNFKDNSVTSEEFGFGGALRGGVSYNNTFENNFSANLGGALYLVDSYNSVFINNSAVNGGAMYGGAVVNCRFTNNTAKENGGAVYNPTKVTDSTFSYNTAGLDTESENVGFGGAIYNTIGLDSITKCIFTNNSAKLSGGAIFISVEDVDKQILSIIDSEFTYNFANLGSAIYNSGKLDLTILGDVTISNNVASSNGAIYFVGNKDNSPSTLTIGDSAKINNIYIFNNFNANSIDELDRDKNNNLIGEIASNLFINFEDGGDVNLVLASNLVGGSKIGVFTQNFISDVKLKEGTTNEYNLIKYLTSTDILTLATRNAFVSDDLDNIEIYSETLYNGSTKTGLGLFIKVIDDKSKTIVYTASDYYGGYDGNEHSVEINVFVPTQNYTIYYSTEENGTYSTTPVTVRDAGESITVWFYIEATGFTRTAKDKRNVAIDKMNIFYGTSDIDINLWFNQTITTKANGGSNVNNFVTASIVDEDGNAVACNFILYASSNTIIGINNVNNSYILDIIPKNTEKYKSITGITVYPVIKYNSLYYSNGYFYPTEEELNSETSVYGASISTYDINSILPFLVDSGIVYFANSYTISNTFNLNVSNRVEFRRYNFLGAIFEVSSSGKLNIETVQDGNLIFRGEENTINNSNGTAGIVNNGDLKIIGNVTFTGLYNYNSSTQGGAIFSSSKLYLENVYINKCISVTNGGGISSTGETTLINCRIENCKAVNGGGVYLVGNAELQNVDIYANFGLNNSTADINSVRGGGLYVAGASSEVSIISSRINNNSFNFITGYTQGGGVYVESGKVNLENSNISFNNSYYGGGLYISANGNVEGNQLYIESNTLQNGTSAQPNLGAGVYVDERATFTLTFGVVRGNGTNTNSTTQNINGIGIFNNGTFNFATYGDTTSQITLNSNLSSVYYGGGIANNGVANLYGGNISQNYTSHGDSNSGSGTFSVGGSVLITGVNYFQGDSSILNVLDNWSNLNNPNNKDYNFEINIQGNRTGVMNPVIVKADSNFKPTWDEWYYISNRITITANLGTNIKEGSTRAISFDVKKDEYKIYYKDEMAAGEGVYYFNPTGGNDLLDGLSVSTALKTWDGVLAKTKPGDLIYINSTWSITDDMNINGEGREIRKLNTWTGSMINIAGSYVPVVNFTNIILDGNKLKDGNVAEGNYGSYLYSGYILYTNVSCKVYFKNVIVRNNCHAYSAIHFYASNADISFTAIDCEFSNNVGKENINYSAVIDIRNANTNFDMYLFNCKFYNNEVFYTSYWYYIGACIRLEGSSSASKTTNIDILNCDFEYNRVHNSASYSTDGKIITFYFSNFGANEKINVNTNNCNFVNNRDTTILSKNQNGAGTLFYIHAPTAAMNIKFTNNNYIDNFAMYSFLRINSDGKLSDVYINNCNFTNNLHYLYGIHIRGLVRAKIENCIFKQDLNSQAIWFETPTSSEIVLNNIQVEDAYYGVYVADGASTLEINNYTYIGNGWGEAIWVGNINSVKLYNIHVEGAERLINLKNVVNGSIFENIYVSNSDYGIVFTDSTTGNLSIKNATFKYIHSYSIRSVCAIGGLRSIYAKDIYVNGKHDYTDGSDTRASLYFQYTNFYGENVELNNCRTGIYLLGGTIGGIKVDNCYYGMFVYNTSAYENNIIDVSIYNSGMDGIQYLYSSQSWRLNTFRNVIVSNCRRYAFYDGTGYFANNLLFENCIFEKSDFGYYRYFNTNNTYDNRDTNTFVGTIFRENRYGLYIDLTYSTTITCTYNFNNCLITNNTREGILLYRRNTYSYFPTFNFDNDTEISYNLVGIRSTSGQGQAWVVIRGGKIINNYTYGVYCTDFINIAGTTSNGVIIKDNGIDASGRKLYNDVYSTRIYMSGKFDIDSIECGVGNNGIFVNGNISNCKPVRVTVLGAPAVDNIIVQGSGYNLTADDLSKFIPSNWNFKLSGNQILLSGLTSTLEEKQNIYYFDPARSRDGSGLLPSDPITDWDKLVEAIQRVIDSGVEPSNIIINIMSSYTVNKNIDGKGATFRRYINPTLTTPSYYFNDSLFKVITGNFTISNMTIDGNSNANNFLSSGVGYLEFYQGTLYQDVMASLANITGNSTLTIDSCYITNFCCKNTILVETGSNLKIINTDFSAIYSSDYGMIRSSGNLLSIDNCNFFNLRHWIIVCFGNDNLRLEITNSSFESMTDCIYFDSNLFTIDNCEFKNCLRNTIQLYRAINPASVIKNSRVEDIRDCFVWMRSYSGASYLNIENVNITRVYNSAFYLENNGNLKSLTANNLTITNCDVGVRFYQYSTINLTEYHSISNVQGMYGPYRSYMYNVFIKVDRSEFISNYNAIMIPEYYHANNYSSTINITNTIIKDTISYAFGLTIYSRPAYMRCINITFDNVQILNCACGIHVDSATLTVKNSVIKGTSYSHAIWMYGYCGWAFNLENTEISDTFGTTYAIYLQSNTNSTSWGTTASINNCLFKNNQYGTLYVDGPYPYVYITDSVFGDRDGNPYRHSYAYASIYTPNSCLVYLAGKVIIKGGIYAGLNTQNIRINGNLSEGSYVRIYLGGNGTNGTSYYIAYSEGATIPYNLKFFHVDGWVPYYTDANNLRIVNLTGVPNPESLKAIYFDPKNGNDNNSGFDYTHPLKTWKKVEEVNYYTDAIIYILGTWDITETTIIDGHGWKLMRCCENTSFQESMFNVLGEGVTLTIKNLILDGNYLSSPRGEQDTGTKLVASKALINAQENTNIVLVDTIIQNAFANDSASAISSQGNLKAENCKFINLYSIGSNNNYNIYIYGINKKEITFDLCQFINCSNYEGSQPISSLIMVSGENSNVIIKNSEMLNNCSYIRNSSNVGIINIEAINSSLTLTNSIFKNGNINNTYGMITSVLVNSESCKTLIKGCLFEENANTSNSESYRNGGAIYVNTNSFVEISGCEFENCFANNGAGVYITCNEVFVKDENNLDIILTDLTFKNCMVTNKFGGAIFVETSAVNGGKLDVNGIKGYYTFGTSAVHINMSNADINISNVELDGSNFANTSVSTNSGGIYINSKNDSKIVLSNVTLKNNVANAGAMSNIETDGEDSTIDINLLQITSGTGSGKLFNIKGGNATLTNSNFSYNNAFSIISFENNKTVKVTALTFTNNLNGYAIYSSSSVGGTHNISEVNITNNSYSGGIYYGGNNNSDSFVTVDNVKVENNFNLVSGITIETSKGVISNSVVKNNTLVGSSIGGYNAELTITYTNISYNALVAKGANLDNSVFISRGIDMFVEMPKDINYSSGSLLIIGGRANLENVDIIGNTSCDFGGGVVSIAPTTISNSNITGNSATTFGGGLVLTMDTEIINSTISNNTAGTNGGGIWFGALLKLTNTKLIGNVSKEDGSAIYSHGEVSSMDISNTSIKQNISYGNGGVYFVNDSGSVELNDVYFETNTGYGKGAALYLNSLTFVESNIVFSGNHIYGTLINFENVANFEMSDFVVSGNYGYGEESTLFSFTTAQGNSSRMLFRDGRIYGNKMEYNASVVIDDGLYIRMTNVEVTGNSNLYSGADLTTDNGKGGAIFVKNGTLVLEDGLAVDNWAEYGAWLFVGSKGKAVISSQEISNISTDAETTINGVIYVEKNGELEFHNCKILGISLSSLKGALNNNGHTLIVDSAIYDNNTANSIIYNGETGVINLSGVDIYSNSTDNGGAIYNLGVINFVSGKIRNNTAELGGAIYNEGDFTLSGGTIINNTAKSGGGIYNKGKVILSSGNIESNTSSASGAGIYNDRDATVIMQGGEITLNTKTESGSNILGSGIANYGSLYMYGGSLFENGSTETGNGGGIYAGANSYNYIENANIFGNLANSTSNGANIYLSEDSYTLIKNSSITSNRESDNNSLMDIYVTNATLILDNVTLSSTALSGSLRADNSDISIINSYISGMKPSVEGASIYINGGSLLVNNSTFERTSSSTGSVIYLDNVTTFSMLNSHFLENNTRALYINVSRVATQVNIKGSTFASNNVTGNGGAILVSGSNSANVNANILIESSSFTSNIASENGGAIYIASSKGAVIELYNSIFGGYIDTNDNGVYDGFDSMVGNYAKIGGAIYISEENPASVVMKGEVEITYNSSLTAGGGVYYAFNGETNYDENIYGLSMQSGATIIIKNNFTNSTATSVSTRDKNNLNLTNLSNKGFLVAELSTDSSIGLTVDEAENELILVKTYKEDIPITSTDLSVFSYDDDLRYTLKLDTEENAIILLATPTDTSEMIVVVSDKVYTMDGKAKTITADDFIVYNAREYTVLFAESEDGEFTEKAPSYVEIKDYTIYYKVVDKSNLNRVVTGSVNFRITGRILSIVEAPNAYLNFGERLSTARFENGIVKSGNLFVSGTWSFENGNTIPGDVNTKYLLTFTPSDKALYENTVSVLVAPTIAFNKVYFYQDRFYNDEAHTSFTGVSTLSNMVNYLKDGGEIFFMSSYTIGSNGVLEETILTNKKVFFYRHNSFTNEPMISIPSNTNTIRFTLGGGTGSIYITGGGSASTTETEPLFSNNGILSINNNVYISNITNTGGGPAVAHNYEGATLNLNGCSIFNTYVEINTALLTGGSIFNEGNMVINGGDYRLNYSVNGNGGFIYNTGSLTINSGLFTRNYTINGSGGCIYTKGGSVVFNGGEFIGNSANYGGVICVDEQGDAIINGANFYSNVALVEGGSVFTISGNVIKNGGDFKFNVNLALKNNSDNKANNQSNNALYVVIALCITALVLGVNVMLIKKKNKNIVKINK